MDDLRVDAGPGAPAVLTVPAAELVEHFSRASHRRRLEDKRARAGLKQDRRRPTAD